MGSRASCWRRRVGLGVAGGLSVLVVLWNLGAWWLEWRGSSEQPPAGSESFVAPGWRLSAARSRHHLRRLMAEGEIPGLAAAVSRHGSIVWSEAVGYADLERQRPVRRDTRFRIQSLSKTITASGLMRLHEQRRIGLDTAIQEYVPSFPTKSGTITARQLASHRSGIRGYRSDEEALRPRHCRTAAEAVAEFQEDPLLFPPDTGSGTRTTATCCLAPRSRARRAAVPGSDPGTGLRPAGHARHRGTARGSHGPAGQRGV